MKKAIAVLAVGVFCVVAVADQRAISGQRDVSHGAVAFHSASMTAERGYEKMTYDGDKVIYVSRKPMLVASDITAAQAVRDPQGSGIQLGLSDLAAARFGAKADKWVGKSLAILMDGKVVSASVIKSAATDGNLMLSGIDEARADRLVRVINRAREVVPDGVMLVADQKVGKPGDKILVDVLVNGLGDVRGYQLALDVSGGQSGRLVLDDVIVDSGRQNYLFAGTESFSAPDIRSSRMMNALPAGTVHPVGQAYLATFVYSVSSDARGDFRISVRGGDATVFLNEATEELEVNKVAETTISIR